MKTKKIESGLSLRWLRRPAYAAMVLIGLAVTVMAQEPRTPTELKPFPSEPAPAVPPLPAQCPSQEIVAGVKDDFVSGNVEATAPSVTLQALVGGPFADFDGTNPDVHFAHTFRLPPCKCLVGAKLEFRAKALGSIPSNDSLTLGFSTLNGFQRWGAYLGNPNSTTAPSLSTPAWGMSPLVRDFSLDLAALPTAPPNSSGPTISLLSAMQTNRYLDFYVQDDTSIDYIKLTVTMCDCCQQQGKAEICITKFFDKNRNGVKDASDTPLQGWTFQASDQAGGNVVMSGATNAEGRICFGVQAPATYTISENAQTGWTQTFPVNPANPVVTVTPGGPVVNLLFGNWRKTVPVLPDDSKNPQ